MTDLQYREHRRMGRASRGFPLEDTYCIGWSCKSRANQKCLDLVEASWWPGKHRLWQALGFVAEFQSFIEAQDATPVAAVGRARFYGPVFACSWRGTS